ncbi:hypothetical protein H2203_000049 [Taxawa tesnikishii (nom. ined.)]|nr:hypothetical protein H2203_000049 [Dothideales sp. JES 119]
MASTPEATGTQDTRRIFAITETQKQALIDNLQLEITERARKLRAQYALQAQGLRARLEMRVNRIPQALRKTKMQDLVDKYAQQQQQQKSAASLNKAAVRDFAPPVPPKTTQAAPGAARVRGLKRSSNDFLSADKENSNPSGNTLDNPKKRAKPNTTISSIPPSSAPSANSRATRTTSRKAPPPSTVLSPKSHNSRTYPHSPLKPASPPAKPAQQQHHPLSPVKMTVTKTTTAAPRPASRTATKRTAAPPQASNIHAYSSSQAQPDGIEGRSSIGTDVSAGTTIVRKPAAATTKKAAATKKTGGIKGALAGLANKRMATAAAKKAEAAAAAAPAPTTAGGRVLRKRGEG